MLECVVNVSEGRDRSVIDGLVAAAGSDLLDLHFDPHHHRSVFTLVGIEAPRRLARVAVDTLDIGQHDGVHPRLGTVDVVPFVPLPGSTMSDALRARDEFARWAARALGVPTFLYGPERTLPEVRRRAWRDLEPDTGGVPHPTAGAMCVGAREVLIAFNVWLTTPDLALARNVARAVRGPHVRALGLQVGDRVQVSMNLVAPDLVGPAEARDAVAAHASVDGCELVGLLPLSVLVATPGDRWCELDLDEDRTIEARLATRGDVHSRH